MTFQKPVKPALAALLLMLGGGYSRPRAGHL